MKRRCEKCGRMIDFIRTANGKLMKIEPTEMYVRANPYGHTLAITVGGRMLRGDHAVKGDPGAVMCYKPHWISCPESRQENKRPSYYKPHSKQTKIVPDKPAKEQPKKAAAETVEQLTLFPAARAGAGF